MLRDKVIYSSDRRNIVFPLSEKGYAPEIGSVFTSFLGPRKDGYRDFTIKRFSNYTGYVKSRPHISESDLEEGEYYRFVVVAVHSRRHHNFFYAIPFRKLGPRESRDINILGATDFLRLRDFSDAVCGVKNRRRYRNNRKFRQLRDVI